MVEKKKNSATKTIAIATGYPILHRGVASLFLKTKAFSVVNSIDFSKYISINTTNRLSYWNTELPNIIDTCVAKIGQSHKPILIVDCGSSSFMQEQGLIFIRLVREKLPSIAIIAWVDPIEYKGKNLNDQNGFKIEAYLNLNVNGLIEFCCPIAEVLNAVEQVSLGYNYVSMFLQKSIQETITKPKPKSRSKHRGLTARQWEIVLLYTQNYTTKEIADKLCLSVATINNHRQKCLEITGAKNLTALVAFALK